MNLLQFFDAFSKETSSLDLSSNNFKPDDLEELLAHLPPRLTTLNLSKNTLFRLPNDALLRIFSRFPGLLTTLNLSDHYSYYLPERGHKKTKSDLEELVANIPLSIQELNLEGVFFEMDCSEVAEILAKLPESIKIVHLQLHIPSDYNLVRIVNGIPSHVTTVTLGGEFNDIIAGRELFNRLTALSFQANPNINVLIAKFITQAKAFMDEQEKNKVSFYSVHQSLIKMLEKTHDLLTQPTEEKHKAYVALAQEMKNECSSELYLCSVIMMALAVAIIPFIPVWAALAVTYYAVPLVTAITTSAIVGGALGVAGAVGYGFFGRPSPTDLSNTMEQLEVATSTLSAS